MKKRIFKIDAIRRLGDRAIVRRTDDGLDYLTSKVEKFFVNGPKETIDGNMIHRRNEEFNDSLPEMFMYIETRNSIYTTHPEMVA